MVARGEVWLAALDPAIGSEIQKTRPCLVVSPPELNDHLRLAIVAPMTSGSRPAGFRVPVRFEGIDGLILLEQCRSIDRRRLVKRLGIVPDAVLNQALGVLRELFME